MKTRNNSARQDFQVERVQRIFPKGKQGLPYEKRRKKQLNALEKTAFWKGMSVKNRIGEGKPPGRQLAIMRSARPHAGLHRFCRVGTPCWPAIFNCEKPSFGAANTRP